MGREGVTYMSQETKNQKIETKKKNNKSGAELAFKISKTY